VCSCLFLNADRKDLDHRLSLLACLQCDKQPKPIL
jgi:hypothetical protein